MSYASNRSITEIVERLAAICNWDAARSYRAEREWFFVNTESHECGYTESRLIERLRKSVLMVHWQDGERSWFFATGCLPSELNAHEQKEYLLQRQRHTGPREHLA